MSDNWFPDLRVTAGQRRLPMLYSTVADTLLVTSAVLLTDYSGGTVRDLHPLPTNIGLK